jgi:hypothetical protein
MPLTSLLHTLESGIIHRLRLAMEPIGVDVQAFPASPVEFELAPYRSQIFFSMQRRRFDPPEIIDSIRRDFSQRMTIEWGLQAEFINLSTHSGVYLVLDRCWLALSGYSPAYTGELEGLNRIVNFEPMALVSESFTGLSEGIYTYNQTWSLSVLVYSDIVQHLADVGLVEIIPGTPGTPGTPDTVRPVDPSIPVPGQPFPLEEIKVGLRRAKANDLEDSVLDQELDYALP